MSLTALPVEVYFDIVERLSLKDLNRLSCVNRYLSVLNRDNYIWKDIFSNDYALPVSDSYYQSYKTKYTEIYNRELMRLRRSYTSTVIPDYKSGLFILPKTQIVLKMMDDGTLKAIGDKLGKVEKDFLHEINISF